MKKVIVFLAPGFEEVEALTPVDYLRRAGVEVTTIATGTASRNVEGARKITVVADMTLETYVSSCAELPDAVIVPGGMPGTVNVSKCHQALSLIDKMNEEGKLVCAICAAPALVLSRTKALVGRKWTCYPDMEGEAGEYAANHVKDVPFVHCENVITSRGAGTAEQFAMEIIRELCGEEKKEEIRKGTIQR
ncbi:DJ-1 family glyoxalase III [Treponema sp.]|uniref:DJ-1 family glyoxalase III n=1 Tax=Treponema sp. TaxID=166 RepID=UPI003890B4D4